MHDLIIIGAGPAGITAAVYAARKQMDFLVVCEDIGGQTAWSGSIENYTGYQFISGPELAAKFEEHMRTFGIALKEQERAEEVRAEGDSIKVRTNKASYEAKSVIIASGKKSRELGVPGEKEFKNKGLTYCATCDGPLFSGKDVVVVGGGNSALDAAIQLMKIARTVTMVNVTATLTGDAVMQERVMNSPVVSVTILHEGTGKVIPAQGVFVEIGLIPNSGFAKDVAKNELGEIKVNSRNETNIPGVFAAGDVTDVPEKQIIIAAGEGSKAALCAYHYLIHNSSF
jgi:alkyl hydroperoxide reductase subunit F